MVSTSEIKFVLTRLGVELSDEELGEMVQVKTTQIFIMTESFFIIFQSISMLNSSFARKPISTGINMSALKSSETSSMRDDCVKYIYVMSSHLQKYILTFPFRKAKVKI